MKTKLILGLFLIGVVCPVNADVESSEQVYEQKTVECRVYYSSTTDFYVLIPKKIVLDNNKTSSYTVKVTGDIASDTKIVVKPNSSFLMRDVSSGNIKKDDVTATVTQEDIDWNWQDVKNSVSKTGKISASSLSAGSWEGAFNFTISLENN